MIGEKYNLSWNEFSSNAGACFREVFEEKHFADVTIVSNDNFLIQAHKVILSSASVVLKNLLLKITDGHPVLYISEVDKKILLPLIEFIYSGNVEIELDNLDRFISLAQKFQIRGLDPDNSDQNGTREANFTSSNSYVNSSLVDQFMDQKTIQRVDRNYVKNDKTDLTGSSFEYKVVEESFSNQQLKQENENFSLSEYQIPVETETPHGPPVDAIQDNYALNTGQTPIEEHPCSMCDYVGKYRMALWRHKKRLHNQ